MPLSKADATPARAWQEDGVRVRAEVTASLFPAKITKALERTTPFDAKNVSITAEGGKVTLGGGVESWYERELVENAAWAVPA